MFDRKRQTPQRTEDRLDSIEARLSAVEQELATGGKFENVTPLIFRDAPQDTGRKQLVPAFVPNSIKLNEQITSYEFAVKAQFGQALLFGLAGTLFGAVIVIGFETTWMLSPVIGAVTTAGALAFLIADHRTLVHKTIDAATVGKRNSQHVLNLNIAGHSVSNPNAVDLLTIRADVTPEQLKTFAAEVSRGVTLAVNHWCGAGSLFTRNQYDSLMAELILMDYVKPSSGNISRQLSKKGKALIRALVE